MVAAAARLTALHRRMLSPRDIRRLAGRQWGDTSYLLRGWSGENNDFAIATKRLEDRKEQGDREEESEEGDDE